ncbi:2-C-methyl-D-erythritol 4-phosphate cytidylyltransferase [Erwinia amylovora]|uniref:2-C-methyl-D-erythritol 4-phosphate cytidylyltransferase n=4 Tax=Erwinia amylovora TaxID=552 RepID=A0A831EPC1_ERWAM|nr:2-C-methyl-D-erythritol 4-phosphate cytidylyltransferase [Erwinia amylovora]CBX79605.1 4-diphosphocytidyl-2C-methyl-D-erythritolsynthase [Erwinia amylovora ATCC BAA-2158]CDK14341.1 4-diphosphocytidyl-2C-methyl-D-erythritolsynthase [Erwinia amylovora LA635]CDK17708.1 4-diphosphocytidyl-2C-methyl-D-erythritolsynthase [Erwinia amylovora LA636]CDK21077.1 4-diphosphocytidyl-2C-methyl-D-erythritolsynthase [Erwinia amylovora LA637]ATZ12448.1 2-C-methyl-D-erythritol 4-phosphate cytidylyltransferase
MNNLISLSNVVAVVPAAGIGSRMLSGCPKQYLTICGKTILEHSLAALLAHPAVSRVVVALSPQDSHFHQLPIARDARVSAVTGGLQRADSVLAGLQAASSAQWALVHDAARPCLHPEDLSRLLALTASSKVGGILAAPVRDTMKRAISGRSDIDHTVEREALWHALTPQLFPVGLLRDCLLRALGEGANITDEASALEYCGYHPELVTGRSDNLKVTRPEDLALAQFYLTQRHR